MDPSPEQEESKHLTHGLLLTFSRCPISPEDMLLWLRAHVAWPTIVYFIISQELHEPDEDEPDQCPEHIHIFLMFSERFLLSVNPSVWRYSPAQWSCTQGSTRYLCDLESRPFHRARGYCMKYGKAFKGIEFKYSTYILNQVFQKNKSLESLLYLGIIRLNDYLFYRQAIAVMPLPHCPRSVQISFTIDPSMVRYPVVNQPESTYIKSFTDSPFWDGYLLQKTVILVLSKPLSRDQWLYILLLYNRYPPAISLSIKGGRVLARWTKLVLWSLTSPPEDLLLRFNIQYPVEVVEQRDYALKLLDDSMVDLWARTTN